MNAQLKEKNQIHDYNWTEKISVANSYLSAQRDLMGGIVEEFSPELVTSLLDKMRIASAQFAGTRSLENKGAVDITLTGVDKSIKFLEIFSDIKTNEGIISEWLATRVSSDATNYVFYADAILGVGADPRYDILVFKGPQTDLLKDIFKNRGYARLLFSDDCINLKTQSADEQKIDTDILDPVLIDAALTAMPNMVECRASNVWFIEPDCASTAQSERELLLDRVRVFYVNRNTMQSMGSKWATQFIQNIPALAANGKTILGLSDALKGSGALVIGAGPSLDQSLEWIKLQHPRPVIICAYKALKALAKAGISPDFVSMLDPNQQLRHLEGIDTTQIAAFALEVSVVPSVVEKIECALLPFSAGASTFDLIKGLNLKGIPLIGSGGSVIHCALQLAVEIGCDEITLIGADFGFPGARLYAQGAGTGDEFNLGQNNGTFTRKALDGDLKLGRLIATKSNEGAALSTSLELDAYRGWTENFIAQSTKKNPELRFINIAKEGAVIQGAPYIRSEEHRCKPAIASPMTIVNKLPRWINNTRALADLGAELLGRSRRLRALERASRRAEAQCSAVSSYAPGVLDEVIRQAPLCPEISLMLSELLVEIDEEHLRAKVDSMARLKDLFKSVASAAANVCSLYRSAECQVAVQSSSSTEKKITKLKVGGLL